jgi:HTH-type transcriptional regulator, competence development regulator
MKLILTKDWFARRATLEEGIDVAAGIPTYHPTPEETQPLAQTPAETRLALGSLVQLTRRKHRLTLEKLAEEARVDLAEVVSIERDPNFRPEPRTIYQLAKILNLPSRGLLQLSGNTMVKDQEFREQAVRFAARSGSVERLTSEEQRALEEYVAFLSEQA